MRRVGLIPTSLCKVWFSLVARSFCLSFLRLCLALDLASLARYLQHLHSHSFNNLRTLAISINNVISLFILCRCFLPLPSSHPRLICKTKKRKPRAPLQFLLTHLRTTHA